MAWLGLTINPDRELFETVYGDNTTPPFGTLLRIPAGPAGVDLEVEELSVASSMLRPGDGVDVLSRFGNRGISPTVDPFTVSIVISPDSVIDSGDTVLGSYTVSDAALGGAASPQVSTPIVVPTGFPGAQFIGLRVDSGAAISELDEANNSQAVMVMVSGLLRCDVNADGSVSVVDVQQVINVALGAPPNGLEDINGDSAVNVIDVQRTISSALGGPCQ